MNCQQVLNMLRRDKHEEIMEQIKSQCFLDETCEIALIMRGNHKEIMAYIAGYSFLPNVELLLIKRGNHEEIMAYVSRYILRSTQAQIALLVRNKRKEIRMYRSKHQFFEGVESAASGLKKTKQGRKACML